MPKLRKQTKDQRLLEIIGQYRDAHEGTEVDLSKVVVWAYDMGLMEPRATDIFKTMRRELAGAARREHVQDEQGRSVRKNHAARKAVIVNGDEVQLTIWDTITDANPEHMRLSIQQRRTAILGDCLQLSTDADSYNDNNRHGASLQYSLNFETDIVEIRHPEEYPESRPEHDSYEDDDE